MSSSVLVVRTRSIALALIVVALAAYLAFSTSANGGSLSGSLSRLLGPAGSQHVVAGNAWARPTDGQA